VLHTCSVPVKQCHASLGCTLTFNTAILVSTWRGGTAALRACTPSCHGYIRNHVHVTGPSSQNQNGEQPHTLRHDMLTVISSGIYMRLRRIQAENRKTSPSAVVLARIFWDAYAPCKGQRSAASNSLFTACSFGRTLGSHILATWRGRKRRKLRTTIKRAKCETGGILS
jgi:hypothetical protein